MTVLEFLRSGISITLIIGESKMTFTGLGMVILFCVGCSMPYFFIELIYALTR